ncbi:MAG: cell division protein FtsQ/DivIB [Alphaproteobacteria bacterium]|nr:cell division protein FtsQ/DivIB [Alphaproteobacteria bacterium]
MTKQTSEVNKNIRKIKRVWPQRLRMSVALISVLAVVVGSIVVVKQRLIAKQLQAVQDYVISKVGEYGFVLQDVVISGRGRTELEDINRVLGLKRGDNFFKIEVEEVKRRLENLPWVRDVTVKRSFLPNILQIQIKEKEVMAIWQLKRQFYPLDFDGYVIEADYKPNEPMLLVVGQDAPEHIKELLEQVKKIDESYVKRIKAANYISKRRWNLTFDDVNGGITVKLPQDNVASALKRLINLDKNTSILKRKLTIIDLRLEDKIIVKMRKEYPNNKGKPQVL